MNLEGFLSSLVGLNFMASYVPPVESNINDSLTIPDWSLSALCAWFSVSLAPDFTKALTPAMMRSAGEGKALILRKAGLPLVGRAIPSGVPMGAGNKRYGTFSQDMITQPDIVPE
jgi:hypothetical protein